METIKEDYVSFEIAKLLKEKGFDENCAALYDLRNGEFREKQTGYVFNNSQWESFIIAPTLQMVMKWLREKDIHILFEITKIQKNPKYYCVIWNTSTIESYIIDLFDSYEEAADDAIKYCLENLI